MTENEWLSVITRRVFSPASRRDVARALAAIVPGLYLGSHSEAEAGKKKRGAGKQSGKNKGKHRKRKPKKPPPIKEPLEEPPARDDICDSTYPGSGQQDNRDHCRRIHEECPPGGSREFCIVDDYPGHEGDLVADCCKEGEHCCGVHNCCPAGRECCQGDDGWQQCCAAGQTCCGGSCCRTDEPWIACCNGQCVDTERHRDHCGACGIPCLANQACVMGQCECFDDDCVNCPAGLEWCGNRCVDTKTDNDHCGGCFTYNPNNLTCCDGNLCTYVDGVCCGGTCYPSYWPSCD